MQSPPGLVPAKAPPPETTLPPRDAGRALDVSRVAAKMPPPGFSDPPPVKAPPPGATHQAQI
eukprot:2842850-Amphidinium_carterae.1